jgi:hypothetical protein
MLRALPAHDAPRDLTPIAAHCERILARILRAESAALSVLDMHSKSMCAVTAPHWLKGAKDQHPIKLSNAAYSVISQDTWRAVYFSHSCVVPSLIRQNCLGHCNYIIMGQACINAILKCCVSFRNWPAPRLVRMLPPFFAKRRSKHRTSQFLLHRMCPRRHLCA